MNEKSKGRSFSYLFSKFTKHYAIILAILALGIVFTFASPYFLNWQNLRNILLQTAPLAIVAIGQALIITTGQFDMSLGQNVCLSSAIAAYLMKFMSVNPWLSIAAGLLAATLVGATNGVLIAICKIPCFVATLGLQNVCRGLVKIITNATPIPSLPEEIDFLGRGFLGGAKSGIPISVVIMLIFYIVFFFITQKTRFGRYIYAIGGGSEAAFFAGINVKKYRILTYSAAGLLAGCGSMVLLSRLNAASVTNGSLYEFDAMISSVIGGVSLAGGRGTLWQVLLGAIFLTLFFNGMTMLNVNSYVQDVLKGVVLVLAVGIDVIRNRPER